MPPRARLDRDTWDRCSRAIGSFIRSEAGGQARMRLAGLALLLLAINGLNVVNSYVGRDFMTALEQRDQPGFARQALLYVAVFALSTLAAVIYRASEESLALLWRRWLTARLISRYLEQKRYYVLKDRGLIENPDQRIAEDVRAFTTTTLSFVLMLTNATLTILAFSGVLGSISPLLFGAALAYAGIGTFSTIALGRPLVWLGYTQADAEASLRADLVHVRENAESIALHRREGRIGARLVRGLEHLTANARRMISVNRNLGFFTTGYNYGIQIVPALITAPLFFSGQVEFGVIPQSAMAFSHLMGAFSLIVTQFQSISSYAVAIARLGALDEAAERSAALETPRVEIAESAGELAWEQLTLRAPGDARILLRDFSARAEPGRLLWISGRDVTALVALFRATAGIWRSGEGRIRRPAPEQISFLPERPYLPPGTLREVLLHSGREAEASDERIAAVLGSLGLAPALERVGGIDVERDWDDLLSLGEQQLVLIARLLLESPHFALIHQIGTTLDPQQIELVLRLLEEAGVACVLLGSGPDGLERELAHLELAADGSWQRVSNQPDLW
jgi:putative ATP-binding cassette transporter